MRINYVGHLIDEEKFSIILHALSHPKEKRGNNSLSRIIIRVIIIKLWQKATSIEFRFRRPR